MPLSWNEVTNTPTFQDLSTSEREQARNQYFDSVVSPQVPSNALASVREQFDADTIEPGIFEDAGNLLKKGWHNLGLGFREVASYVLPDFVVNTLDGIDEAVYGKPSKELMESWSAEAESNLSTAQQKASQKKWWGDEWWSPGEALSDPRSYYGGFLESLPETAATMGPSMRVMKMVYGATLAKEVAKGVTKEVAKKAAKKKAIQAATLTGAFSEGTLGGGHASIEVRDQILGMGDDLLLKSEAIQSLMARGMSLEDAKARLADDQATQAFVTGSIATGIFSGLGDRFLAKILMGDVSGGMLKRMAKGYVSEGLFEEAPQELFTQMAQNIALQTADPSIATGKDVLGAAVGGAAIGGMMGAGFGMAGRSAAIDKADADADKGGAENVEITKNVTDQPDVDSAIAAAGEILNQPALSPEETFQKEQEAVQKEQVSLQESMERQRTINAEMAKPVVAAPTEAVAPVTPQAPVVTPQVDPLRAEAVVDPSKVVAPAEAVPPAEAVAQTEAVTPAEAVTQTEAAPAEAQRAALEVKATESEAAYTAAGVKADAAVKVAEKYNRKNRKTPSEENKAKLIDALDTADALIVEASNAKRVMFSDQKAVVQSQVQAPAKETWAEKKAAKVAPAEAVAPKTEAVTEKPGQRIPAETKAEVGTELAGERSPEAIASLTALLNDSKAKHVSGTLTGGKDAKGNRVPEWTPVPGKEGFFARQYIRNNNAIQEVKSPSGSIVLRRMDSQGVVSADMEWTGTPDDGLSGAAFAEFNDFFDSGNAQPKAGVKRLTKKPAKETWAEKKAKKAVAPKPEVTTDPLREKAREYSSQDGYKSYLRGRYGKAGIPENAMQVWEEEHPTDKKAKEPAKKGLNLKLIRIDQTYEIAETGKEQTIAESADVLLQQADGRLNQLNALRRCL